MIEDGHQVGLVHVLGQLLRIVPVQP